VKLQYSGPWVPPVIERGLVMRSENGTGFGKGGNVHVKTGILLAAMILVAGPLVDYSRTFIAQHQLAQAIDVTALASRAAVDQPNDRLKDFVLRHFQAGYSGDKTGVAANVDISLSSGKITITATATVPTLVLGFVGINSFNIATSSEISQSIITAGVKAQDFASLRLF